MLPFLPDHSPFHTKMFSFMTLALMALLVSFGKNPEKEFPGFRTLVREGNRDGVIELGEELLQVLEERSTWVLEESTPENPLLERSLDGRVVAWYDGSDVIVFREKKKESFSVSLVPDRLVLSSTGRYLSAIKENAGACLYSIQDTSRPDLDPFQGTASSCSGIPVPLDRPHMAFRMENGDLYSSAIGENDGKLVIGAGQKQLSAGLFKPKYTKILNRMTLQDGGPDNLLLFLGSGGYYRFYTYNTSSGDLDLTLDGAASPLPIPGSSGAFPVPNRAENHDDLDTIPTGTGVTWNFFLYSGPAGKLRLNEYGLVNGQWRRQDSFSADPIRNLFFAGDKRRFLVQIEGRTYLADLEKGEKIPLFMDRNPVLLYNDGIIYRNNRGELRLRRTMAGEMETEIAVEVELAREGKSNPGENNLEGENHES